MLASIKNIYQICRMPEITWASSVNVFGISALSLPSAESDPTPTAPTRSALKRVTDHQGFISRKPKEESQHDIRSYGGAQHVV